VPHRRKRGAREPTQAYFKHKRRYYLRDKKKWEREYMIWLPDSSPFLPTDEALTALLRQYRSIQLIELYRYPDRDFFIVRTKDQNFFRSRSPGQRFVRRNFLEKVLRMSNPARDLSVGICKEADDFLALTGYDKIEWTGKVLLAFHDYTPYRRENIPKEFRLSFKELERLCGGRLPFTYKAAPS
jgi:hypothetical protein